MAISSLEFMSSMVLVAPKSSLNQSLTFLNAKVIKLEVQPQLWDSIAEAAIPMLYEQLKH